LLLQAALGFSSGLGGFEVRLGDQHQVDLLEGALAAVAPDNPSRPLLLARLSVALSLVDSEARRLALAEEAVSEARAIGDPVVLAQALAAHCDATAGPAYSEQRRDEATEIVELSRRHGVREQELLGLRLLFVALLELGEPDAWSVASAFERLAETLRQPLYLGYVPLWRSTQATLSGNFDEARRQNAEAVRIGAVTSSENALMLTQVQRLMIAFEADEVESLGAMVDEMVIPIGEIAESLPERALTLAVVGRTDEARAVLGRAAAVGYWRWDDQEWLPALSTAAKAAVALSDRAHAEQLLPLIAPYANRVAFEGIGAGCWGVLARECGLLAAMLGRSDEARDYLRAAIERNLRAGMPRLAEAARADLEALDGPPPVDSTAALSRDGDVWSMRWGGHKIRLRDAKGVRDLAVLLAQPGQSVHVLELVGAAEENTEPVLDRQALSAYRNRLREIDDELDAAMSNADEGRASKLTAEREFLTAELSAALGLGGRVRQTSGSTERARKAVAARIRDTITRISSDHPSLGTHLKHSVRTGTWCVYEPEHPTLWTVA
jgi:tetratricopeptide (TPR) repeat protein